MSLADSETPPPSLQLPCASLQHVAFFDRDNDGVLWPVESYVGLRGVGCNRLVSARAVPCIHVSFSYVSGRPHPARPGRATPT